MPLSPMSHRKALLGGSKESLDRIVSAAACLCQPRSRQHVGSHKGLGDKAKKTDTYTAFLSAPHIRSFGMEALDSYLERKLRARSFCHIRLDSGSAKWELERYAVLLSLEPEQLGSGRSSLALGHLPVKAHNGSPRAVMPLVRWLSMVDWGWILLGFDAGSCREVTYLWAGTATGLLLWTACSLSYAEQEKHTPVS